MNKTVKGWLIVVLIFVVAPALGLKFLWKDRCKVQEVNTSDSPDGVWRVTIDHKDCGPAMKVATEAQLAPMSDLDDQKLIMLLHGPHAVSVAWTPEGVELTPPRDATVVSRVHQFESVQVTVKTQ